MTRIIWWDFHGVLEKNNIYALQKVINASFQKFGHASRITLAQVREHYGSSLDAFFRAVNKSLPEEEIQNLCAYASHVTQKITPQIIKPNDHAAHVLGQLCERGYQHGVVSNVDQSTIEFFTDVVGLTPFFTHRIGVQGFSSYHGVPLNGSVVQRKGAIMKHHGGVAMIGDRMSDMRAARYAELQSFHYQNACVPDTEITDADADHHITCLREVLHVLS